MKIYHRSIWSSFLLAICCGALLLLKGGRSQAFVAPSLQGQSRNNHNSLSKTRSYASGASDDNVDYSDAETQEMKDLILSLSLEPTDHDRRTRVKDVFHEALARPNGMPKRFAELFDKVLIEVGDQVQNEAKKRFFEDQASSKAGEEEKEGEEEATSLPHDDGAIRDEEEDYVPPAREKTPEEFQLWALVDMMVQTKTIVKKENNELGNMGTFQ